MRLEWILSDRIRVAMTSADVNGALQAIAERNIAVFDVVYEDVLHICFSIHEKNRSALLVLAQNRGEQIEIEQSNRLARILFMPYRRPVLMVGLALIVFLACWLPTRVLFVRVEGNKTIPAKSILEQARLCGIRFGANRREVRSEKMKNSLLAALPELQWAGINTYGCTAVIMVRERNDLHAANENTGLVSIVALRDSIIREIIVHQGNSLCVVGQVVKAGQTLVSAYTDCGIYIRATGAKAEIYGDTQRSLSVILPTEFDGRASILRNYKKYSLVIGKKRINFFQGSGILGGTCAKICVEKYITLPGGFVLPIGIVCEQIIEYNVSTVILDSAESILSQFADVYLRNLMQAGNVQRADCVYFHGEDFCRLEGTFSCYEMIGTTRTEEAIKEYE